MSATNTNLALKLPPSIAQPSDIGLVKRELDLIDNHLSQEAIRHPKKDITVKTSQKLNDLIEASKIDLSNKDQRAQLISALAKLKESAPVANISFSSEAGDDFIVKLVAWFRKEIDPNCLIVVGLDPSIGIGSRLRTTNKVFDFSLKNRLKSNLDLLVEEISKLSELNTGSQG